ncbi:MAG TPA: ATP-binding protein [Chthoniobacterales bacterium]|jgi:NtrC-family two-component system sensor histidine kinase KinB|nr:ATP-binding protein [Chthoniobacterales bacterium]
MKKRILLWLCSILVLFLGVGFYAVWLFNQLGGSIEVILRENYQSVLAGQQMKESSERMDSGLAFALAGEEQRGRDLFNSNVPIFQESLKKELNNITLPGEGELAEGIKRSEERYQQLAKTFWGISDLEARRNMYFSQLLPLFTEIKNNAQEVIRINQENMVEADHHARSLSADSTRTMVLLLGFGVVLATSLAFGLQRAILKPIQTLTTVSKELGEGKLDQVVPVQSKDELGQLADAFNKLAAKLRAYRQITTDQILQARQMTEITFSAFPDPILALSLDGKINFANPAAGKLLQKLTVEQGLPFAIQEEVDNVLKGAPDNVPTSFENAIPVRLDDHEAFLLPKVIGMRDESGNLFGAAVVLQDVTRFRLMDEVKTNLVSTVSHELKTPLTSIRMGLHLLLEEKIGPLNTKQLELLLAAREDSERLLRMINDLLDLARLESGHTRQRLEVVSPQTLIDDALPNLRSLLEAQDSRLVTDVAPDLPEVTVDSRQISHVFSNFVSNAARFSKPGEEIVLSVKQIGKTVRFSVVDHGPGIAKEFQSRVFERFFRIPGTEESNGVGLGLAIAKEIVVAHGGNIGLRSVPGEGSEFYFDLPVISKNGNGVKA